MTGDVAPEQPLHGGHPMQVMVVEVRADRTQASKPGCRRAFRVCACCIHEASNERFSSSSMDPGVNEAKGVVAIPVTGRSGSKIRFDD